MPLQVERRRKVISMIHCLKRCLTKAWDGPVPWQRGRVDAGVPGRSLSHT